MWRRLWARLLRRPAQVHIPGPESLATPGSRRPPPPPPPPLQVEAPAQAPAEASEKVSEPVIPTPGRGPVPVRLVFQDGRVQDLPTDPALAERVAYLVSNLVPNNPPGVPAPAGSSGGVRLVFGDGTSAELAVPPEAAARLDYLITNLLAGAGRTRGGPGVKSSPR